MNMVKVVPPQTPTIVVTLPGRSAVNLDRREAKELRIQLDDALRQTEEN